MMIGVLVTTYGDLPAAFVQAAEAVFGKQELLESVAVQPDERREEIAYHLQNTVQKLLQACPGVIVLAGVYGESNCSLCQSLFAGLPVQVVTGVNIPMLFKVLTYRHSLDLEELAQCAHDGGQAGIRIAETTCL